MIAKCAFATDVPVYKNPHAIFTKKMKQLNTPALFRILSYVLLPNFILKWIEFSIQSIESLEYFVEMTKKIYNERKSGELVENDFIQMLFNAAGPSDYAKGVEHLKDITRSSLSHETQEDLEKQAKMLNKTNSRRKLTPNEIMAQCLVFLNGFDGAASTVAYAAHYLALQPEWQGEIVNEIKNICEDPENIKYEELNKLNILDWVVSEALRLYPPGAFTFRLTADDYYIPEYDLNLEKGTSVQIPVYSMHRDEENFENPDEFHPERFSPENIHKIKPYTYLPFGAGPRNCIGMRFSMVMMKVVLAKILVKYRLMPSSRTDIPLKFKCGTPSLDAYSVYLQFQERCN